MIVIYDRLIQASDWNLEVDFFFFLFNVLLCFLFQYTLMKSFSNHWCACVGVRRRAAWVAPWCSPPRAAPCRAVPCRAPVSTRGGGPAVHLHPHPLALLTARSGLYIYTFFFLFPPSVCVVTTEHEGSCNTISLVYVACQFALASLAVRLSALHGPAWEEQPLGVGGGEQTLTHECIIPKWKEQAYPDSKTGFLHGFTDNS